MPIGDTQGGSPVSSTSQPESGLRTHKQDTVSRLLPSFQLKEIAQHEFPYFSLVTKLLPDR